MKHGTLCYLLSNNRVCLGLKKRGFGVNRWNGFGGKVEAWESIEAAVKREVNEEAGVVPSNLEKVAEFNFTFPKAPTAWGMVVHVYFSREWSGEPSESEEMRPQWFTFEEIPYEQSWPDDKIWLPVVLSGKKVKGEFSFDENDKILEHTLEPVDGF